MRIRWAIIVIIAVLCLLLFSFRRFFLPTPIERILADPRGYDEKVVVVQGRVRDSLGILGYGTYQLDDGSGRISVVTDTGIPRTGSRVRVRGLVKNAFTIGDASLTVVIEKKR